MGMSVTAIIPTFNRASVLGRALASVLGQIDPPDEIIVVDDGSTDNTSEVCGRFGSRVRYVQQENRGVAAARNRGIREAEGEYLAFLDSDDAWLPEKLTVHLQAHRECPGAGWSVSDALLTRPGDPAEVVARAFERGFPVFENGKVDAHEHFGGSLEQVEIRVGRDSIPVFSGDAFDLLFSGNFVFPSCAVIHRSVVSLAGTFDETMRVAEDTEFFHRISAESHCLVISASLTEYSLGGSDSLTHGSNTVESVRNALESLERASSLRAPSAAGLQRKKRCQQALMSRLAYAYLTEFRKLDSRSTLREMRQCGLKRSWRDFLTYSATWIPDQLLALAAASRRVIR